MPGQRYESGHKLPKIARIPSALHHKICQFTYRNMPLDVCLSSVFTLSGIFSFITMYFHDISFYAVDYEKKYSIWEGKPIKVDKPNCIYILKLEA